MNKHLASKLYMRSISPLLPCIQHWMDVNSIHSGSTALGELSEYKFWYLIDRKLVGLRVVFFAWLWTETS
jgi:hypothetical protein